MHYMADLYFTIVACQDSKCSIGLGSRLGSKSLSYLPLHHYRDALQERAFTEDVEQEGRCNVVRQIGNELRPGQPLALPKAGPVQLQGILPDNLPIIIIANGLLENRLQPPINLQ